MSDLVKFLAERYAEDWAAARDLELDACQDESRATRDVDAKRKILAAHAPGYPVTFPEPSGQPTCGVCHAGGWDWDPESWPCPTVRALAAAYSDHPDYDPAWAAS